MYLEEDVSQIEVASTPLVDEEQEEEEVMAEPKDAKKTKKDEKKAEKEVGAFRVRQGFASFLTSLSEVIWRIDKLFR